MPARTPKLGASKRRLARQLAVLIALIGSLLGGSSDAEAILCEVETENSQLMSTVADAVANQSARTFAQASISAAAPKQDAPPKQECDAISSSDCDINLPAGHPQPPETKTSLRSNAALPPNQHGLAIVRPARGHYDNIPVELQPGHYGTLYRPPRS